MGWHKTDVDGRVMWESPEGERIADPANIPGNDSRQSAATPIELGGVGTSFLIGLIVGAVIGLVIGILLRGVN